MKIVEALKELKLIEKRMAKNTQYINKYACILSTERPHFETEDAQRNEIHSLIQANNDLMARYLELKKMIEKTNLEVKVKIGDDVFALSDLLVIKRKMAKLMIGTYNALNDREAITKMQYARNTGEKAHIIRMFSESAKNNKLRYWDDLYNDIDSRLEIINATTDLVE